MEDCIARGIGIAHNLAQAVDAKCVAKSATERSEVDWRAAAVRPKSGLVMSIAESCISNELAGYIDGFCHAVHTAERSKIDSRDATVGPNGGIIVCAAERGRITNNLPGVIDAKRL